MRLEFIAARWLQFEKNCALVLCERTPRYGHGQPDVLGVTPGRHFYEIEIKRTVADFRANHLKNHMLHRMHHSMEIQEEAAKRAPKLFWFLVPQKLVDKIKDEVPDFAGLLTMHSNETSLEVIKKAPTNKHATRLSIKETSRLVRCAGNMMIAMMAGMCNARRLGSQDPGFMDDFYSEPVTDYKSGRDDNGRFKTKPSNYVNFQI